MSQFQNLFSFSIPANTLLSVECVKQIEGIKHPNQKRINFFFKMFRGIQNSSSPTGRTWDIKNGINMKISPYELLALAESIELCAKHGEKAKEKFGVNRIFRPDKKALYVAYQAVQKKGQTDITPTIWINFVHTENNKIALPLEVPQALALAASLKTLSAKATEIEIADEMSRGGTRTDYSNDDTSDNSGFDSQPSEGGAPTSSGDDFFGDDEL